MRSTTCSEAEEMQRYMERGVIEIAPLAYMRGRTLNRAFVVLDEAQNTTTEQMFMFLTRLGAESKASSPATTRRSICRPTSARAWSKPCRRSSTSRASASAISRDRDVIRHELVQSIVRAYRRHRGAGETETKR